MTVSISIQKWSKLEKPRITIRDVSSAVGIIIAALPAFAFRRMYCKMLQQCKIESLRQAIGRFDVQWKLTPGALDDNGVLFDRSQIPIPQFYDH